MPMTLLVGLDRCRRSVALTMVRLLPAEGRAEAFEAIRATMSVVPADWNAPYSNAVAVADDAAPIDRLVTWIGRTP